MNAVSVPRDDAPGVLLDLCRATASTGPWTGMPAGDVTGWRRLTELADEHGLVPLLHAQRRRQDLTAVPGDLTERWTKQYHAQRLRSACGVHQVRELAAKCAAQGVELLLLKGSAALLWLYADPGMRLLGDVDILARVTDVDRVVRILDGLGYRAVGEEPPRKSVEEALLAQQRRVHLPQMKRPHQLPIELHLRLFRHVKYDPWLPELWSNALVPDAAQPCLKVLSPTHFLLHGCSHYLKHLRQGFCPLKSLMDLLLVLRRHGAALDWQELWATAHRWEIREEVATVLGTIEHLWAPRVYGIPPGTLLLTEEQLIFGRPLAPAPDEWERSWSYAARARELRGFPGRARYLFRMLFPEPDYLRRRFNLPPDHSLFRAYISYSVAGVLRAASRLARTQHRRPPERHRAGPPRETKDD